MTAVTDRRPPARRRAVDFAAVVARAVTWRAVVLTQSLGLLFAIIPWLETLGQRANGYLLFQLVQEAVGGLCVMLAALAGDEAVRRGWRVWQAFVVVTLCASLATALAQLGLDAGLRIADPMAGMRRFLLTFFGVEHPVGYGADGVPEPPECAAHPGRRARGGAGAPTGRAAADRLAPGCHRDAGGPTGHPAAS